jgi:FkbM family methyltransferase
MPIEQSLRQRLSAWLQPRLDPRIRIVEGGVSIVLPASTDTAVFYAGWKPSWTQGLFQRLVNHTDGAFVDVGANVGQTLIDLYMFDSRVPYLGFEPNPECINRLRSIVRLNRLRNHQVVPVALAAASGCRTFFRHPDYDVDTCGSIVEDLRPTGDFQRDIVPCYRFDDVHRQLGLGPVGFVKIDVEGAEAEVVEGMRETLATYTPPILCEVLFTDAKATLNATRLRNTRLSGLLSTLGYAIFQLVKSSDGGRLAGLRRLTEFELAYWSNENRHLCDYLFLPADRDTTGIAPTVD